MATLKDTRDEAAFVVTVISEADRTRRPLRGWRVTQTDCHVWFFCFEGLRPILNHTHTFVVTSCSAVNQKKRRPEVLVGCGL